MISLNKFFGEKTYLLPVVGGWGQVEGRKFYVPGIQDGFYNLTESSGTRHFSKATPLEVFKAMQGKKLLRFYSFGEEGIPVNFDNLKQKGFGQTVKINFLNQKTFEVVKTILWEDNRFYYFDIDMHFKRDKMRLLKEAFETEKGIDKIRGITPEQAYLFLLASFSRQSFRELEQLKVFALAKEEREKRIREFKNSFAGTLQKTIEGAGGILIKFEKANANSYLVHWRIKGSSQTIKSIINLNMRILSLGYCASGADRDHSLGSAINLAKVYNEDEGGLFITRY